MFAAIAPGGAAFGVDGFLREEAGAVEVEARGQDAQGEVVDGGGVAARYVAVAGVLAHHGAVFALPRGRCRCRAGAGRQSPREWCKFGRPIRRPSVFSGKVVFACNITTRGKTDDRTQYELD